MKKITKGAIALGAAALLLAGGAGTMAAWSDEASLGGGEVTAGHLRITEAAAGAWTWADGETFDPATDLIVPGDVVEYPPPMISMSRAPTSSPRLPRLSAALMRPASAST